MNSSYPDQSGEGAAQGGEHASYHDASGGPPAAGNVYSAQFQQPQQHQIPDLNANAPMLKSVDGRRTSRQVIGFMAALVFLVGLAIVASFHYLLSNQDSQHSKPQEEVVNLSAPPKYPQLAASPTTPAVSMPASQPQAQAIPVVPGPGPVRSMPSPVAEAPRGPTLVERRIMDGNGGAATGVSAGGNPFLAAQQQQMAALMGGMQQGAASEPGGAGVPPGGGAPDGRPVGVGGGLVDPNGIPGNAAYKAPALAQVSNAKPLAHPDTVMTRGTYIRCVLETHIVTDVPGFTSCIVTEPVYSFTGKRLLLPKGSKVLGKYETEPNGPRVAVIWDRIITPTGIDVNMASPGIDNLGGAGVPGYLDEHWGERIGAALLISMLSDAFSYEAAEHGPSTTTVSNGMMTQSPWQSNTAQTLQNLANMAVRRAANRPATVTINQGTVIYVYVARDVDFSGVVASF